VYESGAWGSPVTLEYEPASVVAQTAIGSTHAVLWSSPSIGWVFASLRGSGSWNTTLLREAEAALEESRAKVSAGTTSSRAMTLACPDFPSAGTR
jgi:hypothetical protein